MRKAHIKPVIKADFTKPLDLEKLESFQEDGDCFGKECEPKDEACSACASLEICLVVMGANLKKEEKEMEQEQGPYLDSVRQDLVPWDNLEQLIKNREKGN